ncbi:MAG TPA: PilZ domain-containing protein [Terriglobales bacterium]|nr:PilZ domain-containing protein [Terriglobales bacterium]
MEFASATSPETAVLAVRPKRRHYRQRVQNLAYVRLDQWNGGIIRDLSESGVAIQAVAPLRADQQVQVRFELLNPKTRIEGRAKVAWADSSGQAGLEFLEIPDRSRHMVKEWIFTQLMATAQHAEAAESVFHHGNGRDPANGLLFAAGVHRPVQSEDEEDGFEELDDTLESVPALESPMSLSAKSLSRVVDSLLLLCAVLLFAIISLGMTNLLPSWPLALALGLGISSAFAAVYWYLFAVCVGMTPGEQLARIAFGSSVDCLDDEPARFR